jgi:hypothetical protein
VGGRSCILDLGNVEMVVWTLEMVAKRILERHIDVVVEVAGLVSDDASGEVSRGAYKDFVDVVLVLAKVLEVRGQLILDTFL